MRYLALVPLPVPALMLGAASLSPVRAASPAVTVSRGPTTQPIVALTFDGGSDRGHSAQILDTFASNNIKGTFPMTGEFAVANPDIIRRIVDEGHQLVNHTFSHPSFTGVTTSHVALTAAARQKQLEDTEAAFVNAAGVGSKPYFRPPYGDYNAGALQHLGDFGFSTCLLWSIDLLGWNGLSRQQIISRALANHGNGYIYLMHVGSDSQEGPALQSIIDGLRNFGYGFATCAEMLSGTAEPPPPLFQNGDTVRVTSGLYLRTEPNLNGRVLLTMPTGTLGTVVGGPSPADGYVWYQLQTEYGIGWAATVSLAKSAPPATPPVPAPPKFVVGNFVRVTSGLYLRTGPGTGTGVIVTMPTGTLGTVKAGPSPLNGYTWYQIETATYGTGWAAAEFLDLSAVGPTTPTTPEPTPPTTPEPTPPTTPVPPSGWSVGAQVRTTDNLRLRSSASTSGSILATMPTGTVCTILSGPQSANGYTWYQVQSSYGTGWAAREYLALTSTTPTTPVPPSGWLAGTQVRTTDNLRLRATASTSGAIRATMPTGTTCTVVSGPQSANGYTWYQVQSSTYGTGWAASQYMVRI